MQLDPVTKKSRQKKTHFLSLSPCFKAEVEDPGKQKALWLRAAVTGPGRKPSEKWGRVCGTRSSGRLLGWALQPQPPPVSQLPAGRTGSEARGTPQEYGKVGTSSGFWGLSKIKSAVFTSYSGPKPQGQWLKSAFGNMWQGPTSCPRSRFECEWKKQVTQKDLFWPGVQTFP